MIRIHVALWSGEWNARRAARLASYGFTATAGYVGSRSVHLSVASDDINLVQPLTVAGTGFVFPCDPNSPAILGNGPYSATNNCSNNLTGTRIDSNWGGGAGIRPVLFDGESTYNSFQAQLKKTASHGIQGQLSYTYGKCSDTSSAPVTGDTYLTSIAVPYPFSEIRGMRRVRFRYSERAGWQLYLEPAFLCIIRVCLEPGERMAAPLASSCTPLTRRSPTVGDGNDPLGTGFNGDFTTNFAGLLPGCNPIHGGVNYLNTACFTPPTAPTSLPLATTANPFGCAPLSIPGYTGAPGRTTVLRTCSGTRAETNSMGRASPPWTSRFSKTPPCRKFRKLLTCSSARSFSIS